MKNRYIFKPDGTVAIICAAPKSKKKGEKEAKFLKRTFERAVKGTKCEGLPYKDMDSSELPDPSQRAKWRHDGEKIEIDESVRTPTEIRNDLESQLEVEVNKGTPDLVKAFKLMKSYIKL